MTTDHWAEPTGSERERWGYVPRRAVGPLGFRAGQREAVAVMAGHGLAAQDSGIEWWSPRRAQWRVGFRRAAADRHRTAVKTYFVEGAGSTRVLVAGLCGPQVTCEGIRLIGRVPSAPDAEMAARAEERGSGVRYGPSGDVGWPDLGFDRGARRAGDSAVSWASSVGP